MRYVEIFTRTSLMESKKLNEGKYADIDFTPPKGVQDAAKRGLEARKNYKGSDKPGMTNKEASKEGIGSGVARATTLSNGKNVSPDTIRKMVGFFARHEKNKNTDRGKIAWDLWGGNPGKTWANKVLKQMEKADKS